MLPVCCLHFVFGLCCQSVVSVFGLRQRLLSVRCLRSVFGLRQRLLSVSCFCVRTSSASAVSLLSVFGLRQPAFAVSPLSPFCVQTSSAFAVSLLSLCSGFVSVCCQSVMLIVFPLCWCLLFSFRLSALVLNLSYEHVY